MRTSTRTHSSSILDDSWDHLKKSSNVERPSETMFSDLVEGTLRIYLAQCMRVDAVLSEDALGCILRILPFGS